MVGASTAASVSCVAASRNTCWKLGHADERRMMASSEMEPHFPISEFPHLKFMREEQKSGPAAIMASM